MWVVEKSNSERRQVMMIEVIIKTMRLEIPSKHTSSVDKA
jgi:negative regulator of replication initiation